MTTSKKSIYILGIYTGHTSTAALLKDGEIVACVSEERFNGIKNYLGFPKQSIAWCLASEKITAKDLMYVSIPALYSAPIHTSDSTQKNKDMSLLKILYSGVGLIRSIWGKLVYYAPLLQPLGTIGYAISTGTIGKYILNREKKFIATHLKINEDKIIQFGHHLAHAATAYYAGPYSNDKTLVLTLDAEGDRECATVSVFDGLSIKKISSTSREHSLGWLYLYVTQYLGMKPMEHEFKVMGLAPYAKEKHVNDIYQRIKHLVELDPKNPTQFKAAFNMQDALYYLRKEMGDVRFDNIAGGFQKLLENRMAEWVIACIKETGIKKIACAGGVFMNVKANKRIIELEQVKEAYFMPSSGDESLAIGACYLAYRHELRSTNVHGHIKPLKHLYLGPSYSNKDVKKFLTTKNFKKKYSIQLSNNIGKDVARILADGNVVARLGGRMEWGARALGNRSIMAHPSNFDIVMLINEQMKNRDFWMPFAPSLLFERANDYIINPKQIPAEHMVLSFDSTKRAMKEIRASMHPYDFTLRPQLVKKETNPEYYNILKEFEKLTGIGGILNTSFNLHGFPIVLGPKEAMYAFENSGLQYLVMEDYIIKKS